MIQTCKSNIMNMYFSYANRQTNTWYEYAHLINCHCRIQSPDENSDQIVLHEICGHKSMWRTDRRSERYHAYLLDLKHKEGTTDINSPHKFPLYGGIRCYHSVPTNLILGYGICLMFALCTDRQNSGHFIDLSIEFCTFSDSIIIETV